MWFRRSRPETTWQWFNPRTGEYSESQSVDVGIEVEFEAPDEEDWVLHITGPEPTVAQRPIIPRVIGVLHEPPPR